MNNILSIPVLIDSSTASTLMQSAEFDELKQILRTTPVSIKVETEDDNCRMVISVDKREARERKRSGAPKKRWFWKETGEEVRYKHVLENMPRSYKRPYKHSIYDKIRDKNGIGISESTFEKKEKLMYENIRLRGLRPLEYEDDNLIF